MTAADLIAIDRATLVQVHAALMGALLALNIAPRFRCGLTDSYRIASGVEAALALLACHFEEPSP